MNTKKNKGRDIGFYVLLLVLAVCIIFTMTRSDDGKDLSYADVVQLFEDEKVESFEYDGSTDELTMKIRQENGKTKEETVSIYNFSLFYSDLGDLVKQQKADGIIKDYEIYQPETNWFGMIIPYIIMFGIILLFWYVMMNKMNGGGGAGAAGKFGKARTRLGSEEKEKKTFADVAGADEEKAELQELVEFLKNPRSFTTMGARIPKGVLLVGPPGTGKTLLAKAVAGEAGVQFLSISGSDFVELYVGVGASRVRDLFDQAKKVAPAIIFIDEIDAVGRQRGSGLGGGHDEREQTLNQLLVEMDGFGNNEGVIVMAATNRADILDNALLRPGRFDRQVYVGLPDIKGREAILKVHSKGKPLAEDVDLNSIAKGTPGFSGADLENLMNEAALLAVRRKHRFITMDDCDEAILKVEMGPEKKSKKMSDKAKRLTAYHEAGHAIAGKYLEHTDPVHYITIIPRGMAGGFTLFRPQEDLESFTSKAEMYEDIVMSLGGRIAEKLFLDDISTGASGDIQHASGIARNMVMRYGMSDKLGPILYDSSDHSIFIGRDFGTTKSYSEETAAIIDEEVKRIFEEAAQHCERILSQHREQLAAVAEYLLEHESMEGEVFHHFCETGEFIEPKKAAHRDDTIERPARKIARFDNDDDYVVKADNAAGDGIRDEAVPEASEPTKLKEDEDKE
ncbi:MAG: ATP-dependent zinc metalloprotease FtsH [Bacillota bacterium]|nr:ATP-dependent zinc metalloprotease FtsH [Bacillota bacterium]